MRIQRAGPTGKTTNDADTANGTSNSDQGQADHEEHGTHCPRQRHEWAASKPVTTHLIPSAGHAVHSAQGGDNDHALQKHTRHEAVLRKRFLMSLIPWILITIIFSNLIQSTSGYIYSTAVSRKQLRLPPFSEASS